MLEKHFKTQELPSKDGYTWTLASRLGAMLIEVEGLYGERDKSWTFVGLEFEENGPQNWFPGNCGNIVIQLNTNAINDEVLAHYQLAHEVVHLLAPSGERGAPVIEEGLATMYSENYLSASYGITDYSKFTNLDSYIEAARLVRELLAFDSDAIRKLRDIEPSFKEMSLDTFAEAGLDYTKDNITKLVASFVRE
ncbi:IrrE N-terminal-like domain-containing protein [Vibrio crassostreae]|uniref:hypothetical protein n=1 Tax=Vibrio crassostreae TaxID=246167 RepID=UPI000F4AA743|nr:hypothetical protein [Vibrio crassostreae]ROO57564.1 hypothetical protein EDB56_101709 [Vibrio crassostreae]ROO64823.1 hypothetical protein EDB58_102718 [Vibrio crassostreae]ROO74617.1 hypothetical protein EDB57_1054 [Vibrio crassostreae]ROO77224.1 hypothetical protein EDB53_1059 [Vibrio crassostreae]ROP14556.1 hypothetical protein EDB33_1162 [Vibrio crassostreae]